MEGAKDTAAAVNATPSVRCIVKLGGAAITCKHEIEKINEENLQTVSSQLRQAMMATISSEKVPGMDWSKRPGVSEFSTAEDFENHPMLYSSNFIVVHGAGSFGHFQASRSGVHKGGLNIPLVKAGFVATRISVTSLNLEIVKALAREGIPSIGMSPFACGWSTLERNIASADLCQVARTIESGFVPVLHGDAVLDDAQGCTILSGDVIIRHLAQILSPKYVVFLQINGSSSSGWPHFKVTVGHGLACPEMCNVHVPTILQKYLQRGHTDVLGVYDRPPTDPDAVLLREIVVNEDGSWFIVKPLQHSNKQVEITVAAHDTTGGMVTKISEAAMIAKLGIDVYIVKAGTNHSFRALQGEINNGIPDDWLGTAIRFSKQDATFPMER